MSNKASDTLWHIRNFVRMMAGKVGISGNSRDAVRLIEKTRAAG